MDNKYKGMTVNERLWTSGLMEAFDKAIRTKDVEKAQAILNEVELTEPNIRPILERHGLVSQDDKSIGA